MSDPSKAKALFAAASVCKNDAIINHFLSTDTTFDLS